MARSKQFAARQGCGCHLCFAPGPSAWATSGAHSWSRSVDPEPRNQNKSKESSRQQHRKTPSKKHEGRCGEHREGGVQGGAEVEKRGR